MESDLTLPGQKNRYITLDTSALLALINNKDRNHVRVKEVLGLYSPPYLISTGVLTEIAFLLETRFGFSAINNFIKDVQKGFFQLEFDLGDLERTRALAERYQNLPLGLADALVIACAERHSGAAISLDRHFWVVAGEGTIQVQP